MPGMEQWKTVPGFPTYEVSDKGRIRSTLVMSALAGAFGHRSVLLHHEGRTKRCLVHRLVAEAFLGPAPYAGAVVHHKNAIPGDNRVENLQWTTQRENLGHRGRPAYSGTRATELWYVIDDFPAYEVSSRGRVRRITVLKPWTMKSGHLAVQIGTGRSRKTVLVHRAVAAAFLGMPLHDKGCVHHMNNQPADNRLRNLEWTTRQRNVQAAAEQNRVGRQRLRPADVLRIRDTAARLRKRTIRDTAKAVIAELGLGLSTCHVEDILAGRVWQWLAVNTEAA